MGYVKIKSHHFVCKARLIRLHLKYFRSGTFHASGNPWQYSTTNLHENSAYRRHFNFPRFWVIITMPWDENFRFSRARKFAFTTVGTTYKWIIPGAPPSLLPTRSPDATAWTTKGKILIDFVVCVVSVINNFNLIGRRAFVSLASLYLPRSLRKYIAKAPTIKMTEFSIIYNVNHSNSYICKFVSFILMQ